MPIYSITTKEVAKEKKLMALQYKPTDEEMAVLGRVQRDYQQGITLRSEGWREFNDLSVLDRQSQDQQAFNAYIPPKDTSDDESWKAQTIRPITRNKVIAIAARITSVLIAPHVFAQNKDDAEDRDAAKVMEDIMEWANDQSGYVRVFLNAVIAMLVNPAACVQVDHQEVKRKVKDVQSNGTWKEKEIVDEDESGFQDQNVPIDEVLLGNMYVQDIQKQPFVIRDRNIDFQAAKLKWGHLENFKYVKPGIRASFCAENSSFYEDQDLSLQNRLVNEVVYYNRYEDLQLVFLSGVMVSKPDQPLKRKDKRLPLIWGGYEQIDEGQFAYFKSLVFKLAPEQAVVDEMWNMVLDGTFLSLMPPAAIYGQDHIDSSVVVPGSVTTFEDPNTKMEVFYPRGDTTAGINVIQQIEASMGEAGQSSLTAEQTRNSTAFGVATAEENARIQLGLFGKMIAQFVRDWGELRIGDIVQHVAVADAAKITTGGVLAYKTILIEKKDSKETTKIQFRSDLPEEEITEEEQMMKDLERLSKAKQSGQKIYDVNPKLFRELKYKVRVSADALFQPAGAIMRALNLEGYDRMVQNPLITGDAESFTNVTKDMLVEQYKPGEADKYVPGANKVADLMKQLSGNQQEQTGQPAEGQPASAQTEELVSPLQTQTIPA